MGLEGSAVLVTGAAAGIGRAIALGAAANGASLILGDVEENGLAETAELAVAKGATVAFERTDVADMSAIKTLVGRGEEECGPIAAAFANAGIEGGIHAPWEYPEAEFSRVIDINVLGIWRTMAAVLPGMVERGHGAIVATASVAGLIGAGGLSAYVASKHAVVGLVKSVALDVVKSGVRVNAICPGMIETAMVDRLEAIEPTIRSGLLTMQPIGRLGTPDEVAEAALWLASPAASFTTGHALTIDGGYVAQ